LAGKQYPYTVEEGKVNRCENCTQLHFKVFPGGLTGRVENIAYRCQKGHFDKPDKYQGGRMITQYYAWAGIIQPNKAVSAAQGQCNDHETCGKVAYHRQEESQQ